MFSVITNQVSPLALIRWCQVGELSGHETKKTWTHFILPAGLGPDALGFVCLFLELEFYDNAMEKNIMSEDEERTGRGWKKR